MIEQLHNWDLELDKIDFIKQVNARSFLLNWSTSSITNTVRLFLSPPKVLTNKAAMESSSTEVRASLYVSFPVNRSTKSECKVRQKDRTSVYVIALYMKSSKLWFYYLRVEST